MTVSLRGDYRVTFAINRNNFKKINVNSIALWDYLNKMNKNIFSIILVFFSSCLHAVTWTRSNSDDQSSKWSNADQITPVNIKDLKLKWTFHSGQTLQMENSVQTNPIYTGAHLIIGTLDGRVIAIDPSLGKMSWEVKLTNPVARRGLVYHNGNLFIPSGNGINVISDLTGKLNTAFGELGKIGTDVSFLPPIVTEKVLYVANITNISAYSLPDGKSLWTKALYKNGISPRIWSGFSFDKELGVLFVVTSDTGNLIPKKHKSGGYSNSVLAIETKTGNIKWQFREIDNDVKDLDMVGPPIVTTLNDKKIVLSLSKSGNLIALDATNGKSIYKNSRHTRLVNGNRFVSFFSSNYFDPNKDITRESPLKTEYVSHKIRNAKFDILATANYQNDIVTFGLHGGAEWPGGAINPLKHVIFVPSNKYPWILRVARKNASSINISDLTKASSAYVDNCLQCHGSDLSGFFSNEHNGDTYYPSLVGITYKKNKSEFISEEKFKSDHKFSNTNFERLGKGITSLGDAGLARSLIRDALIKINSPTIYSVADYLYELKYSNTGRRKLDVNSIRSSELEKIYNLLSDVDAKISNTKEGFESFGFWQLLLDQDGLPGSKPPWGLLTALDYSTGRLIWQRPLGTVKHPSLSQNIEGDRNFGGVLATKGNLIFVNGTTDRMARAFDQVNGQELWATKMSASGSAPPTTFIHKGCQYVIFTSSGGRYVGFDKASDTTEAFTLYDCP